MFKKIFFSIITISLYLYSCSSQTITSEKQKSFIAQLNSEVKTSDILGINDLIEIRVYGEKELTRTYRINSSGIIVYPIIGKVNVINRSIYDITQEIEERLRKSFLKNPQVTIFLKEADSRKVYILGQVKRPGAYPYKHKLTLLKLISTSGGFTNIADMNKIILKREIKGKVNSVTINATLIIKGLTEDLLLAPEDIIYVSESWL